MSFLLGCPSCGVRDVNEFACAGELTTRPGPEATLRELTSYLYFRRNVAGVPKRRGCAEPAREGARVRAQNVLGSLEHALMAVVDKVGGRFMPVGFYYRTMIRPRRAWPLYERVLRHAAGLGKVDKDARRTGRFDTEHRSV